MTNPLSFTPAASIGTTLYRQLRSDIIQARLRPGQALSEAEVARRYSVSRQPVREAFIRLEDAGLVKVIPHRGTFVQKISQQAVTETRFVREALEIAIVRALAANPAPLPDLRALVEQQKDVEHRDNASFLLLDEAFHAGLARAAQHSFAWAVIETTKAQMDRVRYLSFGEATPFHILIEQHTAILDAAEAGDADAAEAAMRVHLTEILKTLPHIRERHMDLFEPPAETMTDPGIG
ncbi:GntR family transcriptional regulator [Paroceanicella profunda]|uniref:GntR family transcriptional regulator n=1 Tax=Paroceanicella profunda TaxID=2579971 RepID=A0A5B8FXX4_9RHOB|nr:GntR family transcriptional regulator [Paroceanicella profunda]QDL91362.1 GntR family transcriptional regulator [Paroceanicella profunda]